MLGLKRFEPGKGRDFPESDQKGQDKNNLVNSQHCGRGESPQAQQLPHDQHCHNLSQGRHFVAEGNSICTLFLGKDIPGKALQRSNRGDFREVHKSSKQYKENGLPCCRQQRYQGIKNPEKPASQEHFDHGALDISRFAEPDHPRNSGKSS